jgi:hypothetical protein
MSAIPSASWANLTTPLWLGNNGSIGAGTISTMTTNHIVLDGQGLDCTSAGGGTLLINGIALASASGLTSSITNWASFPALSTIAYTTSGGSGGLINMNVGQFSTLQNQLGSISSLNVSSINGYNANSSGGTIVDTTHQYVYSTSNVSNITATPAAVAGVTNGLYTLVTGKQYLVQVPLTGYNADPTGTSALYAGISLGSATTICWPAVFDSSTTATTQQQEPKFAQGVVTATGTDGGLQLWLWRGSIALSGGSIQIYVNNTNPIGGFSNLSNGVVITQLN